jgi:NTE family protein
VVLSGGGNLGALQVGMLRALVEAGISADVVLGCSIGAVNGAAFARSPDEQGIERLVAFWTRPESGERVMPGSRLPPLVQLLRKGESLHSPDGLRSRLEWLYGPDADFEDLAVPFQCVAAEVETAAETWFDSGPLVPPIMASSSLPAVYPATTIDGRRYLDGGVVNNVPVARAVELGCREIIVLHVGLHGRPDARIRRPLDAALEAYWVARNARFANDLMNLPAGIEAIILPPGERPDIRYDDFSQSAELIARGHRNAAAFLADRARELDRRGTAGALDRLRDGVLSRRWVADARRAAVDPGGAVLRTEGEPEPPAELDDPPDPLP